VAVVPSTRIRENGIIIAFFALLSISGALFMAINTGQRFGPLPPQYRVSFEVTDAAGLVEGSDVRIAGIPVGRVTAVETTDRGARVTLGIEPGKGYEPVYTDGVVLIRPKSLLGEKYVDMQRGVSNMPIPDGGSLPRSQAFTQVEVDQILNNSDPKTRAALSTNFTALGQGFAGRGQDINATIPELRRIAEHLTSVSSRFKDRTAQIDHILVDTDTILTTLADEHAQLSQLLQGADSVTGAIATNDAHLAGLLNSAGSTFQRINAAVGQQQNDQNIRTSIEELPALLSKVGTFFSLTNHDVNALVPSLLLGQQFGFPNNQLTVATPSNQQMVPRWDDANRVFDTGPGGNGLAPDGQFHGFLGLALQCDGPDTAPDGQGGVVTRLQGAYTCPGYAGGKAPGYGSLTALAPSQGSTVAVTPTSASTASPDLDRAFLDYLLSQ
jgi:virulence factor Mce-like protein